MREQGLASPVLTDEREQPMLDLVPLARARREMRHADREAALVGEFLKLPLPQSDAGSVAPAAVGRDHERPRLGVCLASEALPPARDRRDGERRRVMIDADAHPADVAREVVDAIWGGLPELL